MKISTVSISYSRKFNLGDYESLELGCSLWAQVEEEEDAEGVVQFLYHQAKASVKVAAMPVLKTSQHQMNKLKNSQAQEKTQNQVGLNKNKDDYENDIFDDVKHEHGDYPGHYDNYG